MTGATPDAFAVFDPVQFAHHGAGSATTTGHVVRKLRQAAVVVTPDDGEFRVPSPAAGWTSVVNRRRPTTTSAGCCLRGETDAAIR